MRRLSIAFVAAAACLAAGGQVAAGAGGAPGPYRHTVDVELTRNVTNNANTLGVKYRFCFDRVVDEGDPFRLAQFIQKTSFAECCAADYPGNNSNP